MQVDQPEGRSTWKLNLALTRRKVRRPDRARATILPGADDDYHLLRIAASRRQQEEGAGQREPSAHFAQRPSTAHRCASPDPGKLSEAEEAKKGHRGGQRNPASLPPPAAHRLYMQRIAGPVYNFTMQRRRTVRANY